jgi:hypothetical protein
LAGNAVNVGNQQNAYPNVSVLYPPSLWGVCINDTVQDNYIRLPNQMYYQFEGISAAYVNGLQLLHNDISNTGYDAITLGWGWGTTNNSTSSGNNRVDYNRINASNQILNAEQFHLLQLYFQRPHCTVHRRWIGILRPHV